MQDSDPALHIVPKREGRGRRKSDNARSWQDGAPRWLLITLVSTLLILTGWLYGRLETKEKEAREKDTREMELLRAAVEQAESKGNQRTLERVAVVEEQIRAIVEENRELKVTMKQMVAATQENTSQLRLLTAQIKRGQ